ncbi:hypothetical protein ACL2XO_26190 [Sodalis sp. RH15]|uniref:hypothetical protein n=1 Tax=Sodalis sp. RH15 TaxID=3394330 RepID=UPI0039B3FE3A
MKKHDEKKTNLKTTISKVADVGTNFALSFVPGASSVYELAKLGVNQARDYIQQKHEKRISDFHMMLLKPDAEWDERTKNVCIEAVDYHLLLNACIQDLEDEKTELYATLARNAAYKTLQSNDIRFFSISLSEMTFHSMEEMRLAYIALNYHLIPPSGSGRFKKSLSITDALSEESYGRRMMELRGFVSEGKINSFGQRFIKACYPSDKLKPDSVRICEWKNPNSPLLMISYDLDDSFVSSFSMHLTRELRNIGFRTTPLCAINRRPTLLSPTSRSILIFKNRPERIIENQRFIEKIIETGCIAIQLRQDYPALLESLRDKFEAIIKTDICDPSISAKEVITQIYTPDK